ncbi:MAG: hypothetical protein H3C34_28220, partial [Caldilineaceae bacterium]|nr:hypothetical protein [Caldilineaceae bacterium]
MQPEFCTSRTVRPGRWFVLLASTVIAATLTLVFWVQPAAAQGDPITIPLARTEPDLDGVCNSFNGEYADAAAFDFADAFGVTGKVYLKHDGASLYVCMIGASSVNSTVGPFGSVYLDTDNGKETFAEKEDLGLRVTIPASTLSAHRGTGSGNYTPDPTVTGWSAAANTGNADQAEWKIPLDLVSANRCDAFGIAVYHHWITAVGDDYG